VPVREGVPQDVGYEVQVRGAVYLWDYEGVEARGVEEGGEVFEGEAGGDGVDSDGELGGVWGSGLGEEGEEVGAGGWLLGGGYGVFEVVGDGVYGEGAGLLEEFGGGGGDWVG
jgi:hypothetical protein